MTGGRESIAGTLALLGGTLAVLFGILLLDDEPASRFAGEESLPGPDPERLLELGIRSTPRVARRVAAIRGLSFERIPEPQLSEAADLVRKAERQLDRPRVKRALAMAQTELRLLGLLEPDQELGKVATEVSSLAAAYYDPGPGELFLVGDAVPAGDQLTEFFLAHELTHALEDQRFGLPQGRGLSDDRLLAERALVEGTATVLMNAYASRHLDPLALAVEAAGIDAGGGGELPRFATAEVEFTYFGGAEFVAALRKLGSRWSLIDYAYKRRLPATTEQVLHPQKYLDDERGVEVAPPPSPGPGWRAVHTGTLGEFGTREVVRAGEHGIAGDLGADVSAAGWGGDRYRLFVRRGKPARCGDNCRATHALGVTWIGDAPVEARELDQGLATYAEEALAGEAVGERAWRLDGGWAVLARRGQRVGLGLAPARRQAASLAGAVG